MIKEIEIDIGWGKLAAVVHGRAGLETFVCLHGWLDNAASFAPLAPFFDQHAQLFCLDLPGHGKSDHRPKDTNYHLVETAVDVMKCCDALGLAKFSLIGHSLGGALAGLIAASFPDRIDRLVLIESLGPLSSEPSEVTLQLRSLYEKIKESKSKQKPVYESIELAIRARRMATELTPESARLLIERSLTKVSDGYTWSSDSRLRFPSQRFTELQVLAFLKKIRCPTLLVQATQGMLKGVDERLRAVSRLTVKKVEGSHHAHMDDAKTTATAIKVWLESQALDPQPL